MIIAQHTVDIVGLDQVSDVGGIGCRLYMKAVGFGLQVQRNHPRKVGFVVDVKYVYFVTLSPLGPWWITHS